MLSMSSKVTHTFQVPSTDEHVPAARSETRKVLEDWGLDDELVATSCLIVTELVTNVVRHAARLSPTALIALSTDEAELTLSVADSHPFRPKALSAPHGSGGWGLALVKTLVEEARGTHDVVPDELTSGKCIVIRMPLAAPPN
jgi:anti-sigma regulatory factor (Ser/Thr protein kinase)